MNDYQNIHYEQQSRIVTITINRPDRMNAINPRTSEELLDAWQRFRDDPEAWVAILTGAGERAFSAGNDLVETARRNREGGALPPAAQRVPFGGNTRGLELWKPTIAAINGYCLAGGLELALACDIRIAAEHAQFGLPEVTWAIIPGAGGTQRLPRAVPLAVAMDMILTAERIDAQAALRWGLVSRVVPASELMAAAVRVAETICTRGPLAVRAAKESISRGLNMPLEHGLALEALFSRQVYTSEDAKEGPRAFAEKRTPNFQVR
jgi:enoyl-CoA hydratase/carnithine racemase